MSKQSSYEFWKEASLSQKLADSASTEEMYPKLAGSDKELSDSIAIISYITDKEKMELMKTDPMQWLLGLLNYLRMSAFATSEKTDILTKLGLQMPKAEDIISKF